MPKRILTVIAIASVAVALVLSTWSPAGAQQATTAPAASQPATTTAPVDPMRDIKVDLKKKLEQAGVDRVSVLHKPARAIPTDAQVVIVHKSLAQVARRAAPNAVVVTFNHFLNDPAFDQVVDAFVKGADISGVKE